MLKITAIFEKDQEGKTINNFRNQHIKALLEDLLVDKSISCPVHINIGTNANIVIETATERGINSTVVTQINNPCCSRFVEILREECSRRNVQVIR